MLKKNNLFFKKILIKNFKLKWIKILNKSLIILPNYINKTFRIYNGNKLISLKIRKEMVGFKFGEFIYTRKKHIYTKKKK